MEKFILFIQEQFKRLSSEQKRLLALVCTIIFSLILIISVLMSIKKPVQVETPDITGRITVIIPIPAEEIFLPDEPDFIPGVLLYREQRSSWTSEDAQEFWQDPLTIGEEVWRERLEAAIDEFLESVP